MSLTFKETANAIPIAKIKNSSRFIFILPNSKVFKPIPETNIIENEYVCPYCKKEFSKKQSLIYHVKNVCVKKTHHMDTFNKYESQDENEIIEKIPALEGFEMVFLSGPPGSGKTFQGKEYIKLYHHIFQNNKIVMFTRHENDETLKEVDSYVTKIIINPKLLEDKFKIEDLANCLVIFDDIETSEYKNVTKYMFELLNDIVKNGRKYNIRTLYMNQELTAGINTRIILQMMTALVIFPQSGSVYHIKRALKEYLGFSAKQVEKVLHLPSRWVYISRCAPQYIIYEHGIYLLSAEEY